MNIVCFGDSVTHAAAFAEGDRWPTVLQAKLNEWKPGKHKVFNKGIGGHTSAQGLDRMGTDLLPFLPGWVVVEFGFNDKHIKAPSTKCRVGLDEYKANMLEICKVSKKNKGKPIIILNHCHEDAKNKKLIRAYNNACLEVAKKMKCSIIDLPKALRKRKVKADNFTVPDGVHLSVEGNHTYADIVFDALKGVLK